MSAPTGERVDYARIDWIWRSHHARYVRRVNAMPRKLVCQDCGGAGGEVINIGLPDGTGPVESCGWCEGTGYVTPWLRGFWLRCKRGVA